MVALRPGGARVVLPGVEADAGSRGAGGLPAADRCLWLGSPTVPEGQDARAARVSSRGQFELALC